MYKPEADITLTIYCVRKDLPNVKECRHVYVHQDTRKAKTPAEIKPKREGMMIDCKIEKMTTQANLGKYYTSSGNKTE